MVSMTVSERRGAPRGRVVYEFGSFRFEPGESRLLRDGRQVPLAPQALETLLALVERNGSLVTKQELMERVWPDRFVEENSLAKCVSELRKALGDRRTGPCYIETVPRRGYRFVAPLSETGGAPPPPPPRFGGAPAGDPIVVRVTVELAPGAAGDSEALGNRVAESVAAALRSRGSRERRDLLRHSTRDVHAYRLYREARCHMLRYTLASWRKGVARYEMAIAQDPCYALAHADLAISSVLASVYYTSAPEVKERARVAARQALSINPGLAEAHLADAVVRSFLDWDWEGAESAFHQALALDPGQSWSLDYYGFFLLHRGRFREALPALERAVELNPTRILVKGDLGLYHHFTGAVEQALDHYGKALDLDPYCGLTRVEHARVLERAGRFDEAEAEARRSLGLDDSLWGRVWLARACAMSGQRLEAYRRLRLLQEAARSGSVSPVFPALVQCALGERAEALEQLEEAWTQRSPWMALLRAEPGFQSLWDERRFQILLQRMGLPG